MYCKWKKNWDETQSHFEKWWTGQGVIMQFGGAPAPQVPHDHQLTHPGNIDSTEERYINAQWRAKRNHYDLARLTYPADNIPIAQTNIGPGSLVLLIGCEPGFSEETVWFEPAFKNTANPESVPPLEFDPGNKWWQIHEATLRECKSLSGDNYFVGCPDLVENVDILFALRDPQTLLFDMIERPEWVGKKIWEINQVFFEAYSRIYEIIKEKDGSSVFGAFELWGPGKTAKVQCDAAAMFSPDMFERFVVPPLTEQCRWLDNSLFHLDGTQCILHLDLLLDIDELDAIEWTPQSGIEGGGNQRWYGIYRKILESGKAVQAIGVAPEEVKPLLEATGGKGMYICVKHATDQQRQELLELAENYR